MSYETSFFREIDLFRIIVYRKHFNTVLLEFTTELKISLILDMYFRDSMTIYTCIYMGSPETNKFRFKCQYSFPSLHSYGYIKQIGKAAEPSISWITAINFIWNECQTDWISISNSRRHLMKNI